VASSKGGNNRAGIWVQIRIPLAKGCTSSAIPTAEEEEDIMDGLIATAQLPFLVDRVQHFCLDEAVQIGEQSHFIGYLLFSPEVTRAHAKPGFVFPATQMAHLENALHELLANDERYRGIPSMPPCIHHIKLRLPVVNSTTEQVHFVMQGLPPSFLQNNGGDDVLTFRHAARDLVIAIRGHYRMLNAKVPDIIAAAARNSHTAASIISLKNVRVAKKGGRGKGDNILMIAITGDPSAGPAMRAAIADLADVALFIAGGSYEIKILPEVTGRNREKLQSFTVAADRHLFKCNKIIVREGVCLGQQAIGRAVDMTMLIPDCQGVIPVLRHGRTNPTFNFLLAYTRNNVRLNAAAIAAAICRAIPELAPPPSATPAPVLPARGTAHGRGFYPQASPAVAIAPRTHQHGRGGPPRIATYPGRGRGGRGGESFRKATTSRIERRISAACKYHIMVNPRYGIYCVGVYYGHWDDDGIKLMVEGCSHKIHFSSDLEMDAYQRLMYWHPQCTGPKEVDRMQRNCILTASNLNNPSIKVRERIGDYSRARSHGAEFICDGAEEMSPEMFASRSAASRRMRAHGAEATPWLSYDFLSPAEQQEMVDREAENAAASGQAAEASRITPQQPPPFEVLEDAMSEGEQEGGDAMSTLSQHTTALSLSPFNSAKRFRGAKGQAVQQFHGAKLTIPMDMALEKVGAAIETLLRAEGYPDECIRFEGLESDPRNAGIKLVYVGFSDSEVAAACLPKLHTILPMAYPIPAAQPPPREDPANMDLTATVSGGPPLNCRVRSCPHWCYGQPYFPPTTEGIRHASSHGRTFHRKLYQQLPGDVLAQIGWFRCEHTCGFLSFGAAEHEGHIATCQHVAAIEAAGTEHARDSRSPSGLDPHAGIRLLCPAEHKPELEAMIGQGAATADLQGLLIAWLASAQAASIAHSNH